MLCPNCEHDEFYEIENGTRIQCRQCGKIFRWPRLRMNKTKIEWCDYTWNPVTGCNHGCEFCYARRIAKRFPIFNNFEPMFYKDRLKEPYKIKKPSRIFVVSMGDLFGDWVSSDWIVDTITVCRDNPQHTFMFLTKNPKRYTFFSDWPSNCWLGYSASNNFDYQTRMNSISKIMHKNIFVSIEPIQENILFTAPSLLPKWVIVGAETGNRTDKIVIKKIWIEEIMSKCHYYDIPLFIKDNLNWPEKIQEFPK